MASAALLAQSSCTVGPNFKPSQPRLAADWNTPSARKISFNPVTEASNPDPAWWSGFNDPMLTKLINQAISGNLDLQQALLRVAEARENVVTARAAGLPTLGGTASYNREQLGLRGILESQGISGQSSLLAGQPAVGQGVNSAVDAAEQPINLFQYGLSASWELDLFGKVRRSVEQARATSEAQAEAASDALVMLESQVGQAYVQLRGAQALFTTQQDNIRAATSSLNLTQRRRATGLATELDVDQAQTQLYNYQRQLPAYATQAQQAENQLSVLLGRPPGMLDAMLDTPAPLPAPPDMIGIGIPSTLARRRPDIREAEANLHAATANIGIAVSSFYPDISLTGSLGIRATDASYLTSWASRFYSVGPSASLPIFQGGKLTSSLRLARIQQKAAVLSYRNTVLNGLREVENALASYHNDLDARDKLIQTVSSSELSFYLSKNSYQHGLSDFITVLNAEQTLTSARQSLDEAKMSVAEDVVTLYTALGGGWQQQPVMVDVPLIEKSPPLVPAAVDSIAAGTHNVQSDPQ
ncbi:efflux transporter outer membrane subunit (plasmid) [Lichenicola cladoniae]|uniref:Efflux transporter outer membrane subunit n=1 Tax=Lichenicola cladoniae TaxID=1484109 RepID=A0A6M8I0K9_9PROT|nr:efflux transporter outer membrane subunit [Lichenicola cladoniae]NPD66643.1 efflux transporter outer membrane subunit [Acetobacteraceae bacterium]QKE93751.1 efflux transporter outer membrane subunit [Lichenicola cladoniae]